MDILRQLINSPMPIRTRIITCSSYLYVLLAVLVAAAIFLLTAGKTASFISLNFFHSSLLNAFFINYTFFGDGVFAICLILFCLIVKQQQVSLQLLLSFIFSSVIVQVLKKTVNAPRPKSFFEVGHYQNFIDGVTGTGYSSFPSGHTATAFALATIIVLMMKNKSWQLPLLFFALLVGYSRIYLGQHFLIDVITGATIGTVCGILSLLTVYKLRESGYFVRKIKLKKRADPVSTTSAVQTI
jgi:membrane-associated phospholipid phosphatase